VIPIVFAFLFHFGREIIKDMEDIDGDKAAAVNTGAVKYGLNFSRRLATITIGLLIAATLAPYILDIYNEGYLLTVVFGVDIFLIYVIYRLYQTPSQKTYRFISGFMKALMPIGITALFLGSRGL